MFQSLQETLRKSEKILELASICRKFETEDEVIRWYDNYIDAANKKDSFLKVDEEEDDIETKLGKEVPPQLQKVFGISLKIYIYKKSHLYPRLLSYCQTVS